MLTGAEPKLREFLSLMAPRAKAQIWANDDGGMLTGASGPNGSDAARTQQQRQQQQQAKVVVADPGPSKVWLHYGCSNPFDKCVQNALWLHACWLDDCIMHA